ncbi:response regulator [Paenibacillus whitsoniae]|uniref:Response regulator n=1 Tax=Paenibacillus whitsoniae TaxID=2496558 RepID=A0A430JL58_9BACL|nr:response regulator [Paenibacillus whitsoniae]RTE11785.1 response regulator [Paenibacillus whitsoniae]
MKIIIIEDELEILQGMKETVIEAAAGKLEILTAANAEDAEVLIRAQRPDIIVSDIVLPQQSGIDMLQAMQMPDYAPKIIIVSGYSDFQYAQRSMQLGAMDYLLKPFSKEAFSTKILHLLDMLEDERKHHQELSGQLKQAELGKKLLKDKFLLSLCMTPTVLQEHIFHRLQMWELTWLADTNFTVIALDIVRQDRPNPLDSQSDLETFSVGNITEELLEAYQPSALFKNIHHNWILIVPSELTGAVVEAIRAGVNKYQYLTVGFGISREQQAFQAISTAYGQAVKALKMALMTPDSYVHRYTEALYADDEPNRLSAELAAALVMEGDLEQIDTTIDLLVRHYATAQEVKDYQDISKKCLEWILSLHSTLREKYGIGLNQIPMALWEELEQCERLEQVKERMLHYLVGIAKKAAVSHSNAIIAKAKQLLEQQFAQNITLQSIADQLQIHPVWLSQLFKKEAGINFLDYVTDLRVEQSKKLLRDSQMKIYEIAESVGYQDLQYFGKVFKKRTGQTPKEFRYGK